MQATGQAMSAHWHFYHYSSIVRHPYLCACKISIALSGLCIFFELAWPTPLFFLLFHQKSIRDYCHAVDAVISGIFIDDQRSLQVAHDGAVVTGRGRDTVSREFRNVKVGHNYLLYHSLGRLTIHSSRHHCYHVSSFLHFHTLSACNAIPSLYHTRALSGHGLVQKASIATM